MTRQIKLRVLEHQCVITKRSKMLFSQCVISCLILILTVQTSHTSSEAINCRPDIDIRFGEQTDNSNKSSLWNKKPHAVEVSHDKLAIAFLSTANLALKLAGNECRQDICSLARKEVNVSGIPEISIAYTALNRMPYGLQLLLCSDVIIRSIVFEEIVLADTHHDNKVQTSRTKSVENEPYRWRFEPVDGENSLLFRVRNVKTNQYLIAERQFTLLGEALRRVVRTDPEKSDVWLLKIISDLNGNFNRFLMMNVPLGEYLYASRGFCYDNITNVKDCTTRPMFTWEYKTLKEAEDDEYNKFIIDDYTLD